jgi:hypothetical protein
MSSIGVVYHGQFHSLLLVSVFPSVVLEHFS